MPIDSNVKITIRTGPMRKLRQVITLKEAKEWAAGSEYGLTWNEYALRLADIASRRNRDDYPDSFYEQPKEGSFGNFGSGVWGYLADIDMSLNRPYVCVRGECYASFAPGLPEDVDADGMPNGR